MRVCSAPQKPIEVNASIESNTTATITWHAVEGASTYSVLRNDKTTPEVVAGLSYVDSGLNEGTDYTYVVKALDSSDNEMGDSGRVLVNTGAGLITSKAAVYENRVYGSLNIRSGIINLNGYTLSIEEGNLIQSGGTLDIEGGSLEVQGDYKKKLNETSYSS